MQERTEHLLRALLTKEVERGNTAGVSLLVRRDGKEEFFDVQGYANLEKREKLRRDHIFRIYSMTKPVTAVAAMILAERGELDLNMPVAEVLPGFRNLTVREGNGTVPAKRPITVLQLMNMTSGLTYGEGDSPDDRAIRLWLEQCGRRLHTDEALTTREFADSLGRFPLAFHPDEGWCYGFSADVLGAVTEAVCGTRLGEFLENELFRPLNMHDTGFWIPDEKYSRFAAAYEPLGNGELKRYSGEYLLISGRMDAPPRFESGGAGLVSTIDDYARFAQMLLNRGVLEGGRILSPRSADYLLSGSLTAAQQQGLRDFGGHEGYTYSHLFRRLTEPGQACLLGQQGEYGWAGWLRCYFANLPASNATILLMQQRKGPETVSLARRVRNILSAEF